MLIYFAILLIYNIDFIDSGFIISYVQRVKEGQIIYKDFDYVRPFGSIIFWDIIITPFWHLKSYLGIILRLLIIFEILIIIQIFFAGLKNIGVKIKNYKLSFLFCSVLIIHTFNLMPWHTIDGIFFLSFAFLFFTKEKFILSIVFACIAATMKQSFYLDFVLIFIINIICIFYQLKKNEIKVKSLKIEYFFIGVILIILSLVNFKYRLHNNIELFFEQTHVNNSTSSFLKAGFKNFLFSEYNFRVILFSAMLLVVIIQKMNRKSTFKLYNFIIIIAIFILYLLPMLKHLLFGFNIEFEGSKTIYLLLLALFLRDLRTYITYDIKKILALIILFFITWSISISWGYSNVLLMLPILVFAFDDNFRISEKINYLVTIIVVVIFIIYRLISPYANKNILEINYVFVNEKIPIYSGMLISEKSYDYIKEAQALQNKYENSIFLPGSPIFEVMFNKNLNRSPWEMDVEYPSWKKDYKQLSKKNIYYILDKKEIINSKTGFFKSSFTQMVKHNKTLIDSTNFYYIYN
ncbi:hypothetical protein ETU10_00450 [Apibacter muscae]|uniref:hypothetical protein n=1 Tax=Apibacter muscae TaxID=2509004 RepID=UPI0011AE0D33|nr:hypothetical protein [Apibacter muscae]TWP25139.1 hypothetical protein ETU10_00450 [Apibacter muscae]